MSYTARFITHPIFLILCVGSAYLIAFSLDYLKDMETEYLFVRTILIATAASCFLGTLISILFFREKGRSITQEFIQDLDDIVKKNNYEWVVNQSYIAKAEGNADETWVFAQELTYAIQPETEIFKGLAKNLNRGARYRFYMPDHPKVHKIIADFFRLHRFEEGQVSFYRVPVEAFVFNAIISIYGMGKDETPTAIEFMPNNNVVVWAEMDQKFTREMVRIGQALAEKYPNATTRSAINVALVNKKKTVRKERS